jgi:GntR family transcriptional repressor for pyruvate dehydrogenase complex
VIGKEKFDQLELFEVRRLLEPQLAYLATARATPAEIAEMEEVVRMQEEDLATNEPKPTPERTLHDVLFKAAKNKIILSIMDNLIDSLAESRDKYLQVDSRPEKSLARHKDILAAVKSGNCDLAEKMMRIHLEETETMLFEVLGKNRDV